MAGPGEYRNGRTTATWLAGEQNAWMALVKGKAGDVSQREILVRQQNAQIAMKKEVVNAVADAQKAVEQARDTRGAAPEAAAETAGATVIQADAVVQAALAGAGSAAGGHVRRRLAGLLLRTTTAFLRGNLSRTFSKSLGPLHKAHRVPPSSGTLQAAISC